MKAEGDLIGGVKISYVLALFFTWLQSTQIDPLFIATKI